MKKFTLLLLCCVVLVSGCKDSELSEQYQDELSRVDQWEYQLRMVKASLHAPAQFSRSREALAEAKTQAESEDFEDALKSLNDYYAAVEDAINVAKAKEATELKAAKLAAEKAGKDAKAAEEAAKRAAELEAQRKAAQKTVNYTVKKGDSLWRISRRNLGTGFRWGEIYQLNKDTIKVPRLIYPNQVFKIPAK
ncbi:MAG: LysM peptidoglycan-binding domain-containing protein [bacterium]|nr:LysM peptidoglycan-binding domain-containing protein [bacterium]